MASEIIVQTLKGPTSGANANKVIIPSGQTLDASSAGLITPSGYIRQVVSSGTSSLVNNSTTTFVDTGLSITIQPVTTSSTVLIQFHMQGYRIMGGSSDGIQMRLLRDTTQIDVPIREVLYPSTSQIEAATISSVIVDAPSSNSNITYKVQYRALVGNQNIQGQANSARSSIVAMEIRG